MPGLEPAGWMHRAFDDRSWSAVRSAGAPPATLEKQFWPPVREKEVFPRQGHRAHGAGRFPRLFRPERIGVLRFVVDGRSGQDFTVQPSEYRTDDGKFMKPKWGEPVQFRYTLKGGGPEQHQWLFHYQGFQAVEVTRSGFQRPAEPRRPAGRTAVGAGTRPHRLGASRRVPHFQPLYNDTHRLIDWALRSNASYVLTIAHIVRSSAGWSARICSCRPSAIGTTAATGWPRSRATFARLRSPPAESSPSHRPIRKRVQWRIHLDRRMGSGWCASFLWQHYVWYGDARILRDNYDCMHRFVDYVSSTSKSRHCPRRPWVTVRVRPRQPPGPSRFTPTDLTATAVQIMCIDAVVRAARGVGSRGGRPASTVHSAKRPPRVTLKTFYDPQKHSFTHKDSCQCAHTISLAAGVVPEKDRQAVAGRRDRGSRKTRLASRHPATSVMSSSFAPWPRRPVRRSASRLLARWPGQLWRNPSRRASPPCRRLGMR